jgi:preprotein translocase subunit YajC
MPVDTVLAGSGFHGRVAEVSEFLSLQSRLIVAPARLL